MTVTDSHNVAMARGGRWEGEEWICDDYDTMEGCTNNYYTCRLCNPDLESDEIREQRLFAAWCSIDPFDDGF